MGLAETPCPSEIRSPTHKIATDARWWIGTLMAFLAFLSLSPYVEERRWPFASWFNYTIGAGATAQKATLTEWLQKAQQERDAARQQLVTLKGVPSQLASLQAELVARDKDMRDERQARTLAERRASSPISA
jgi:hypothetical protein